MVADGWLRIQSHLHEELRRSFPFVTFRPLSWKPKSSTSIAPWKSSFAARHSNEHREARGHWLDILRGCRMPRRPCRPSAVSIGADLQLRGGHSFDKQTPPYIRRLWRKVLFAYTIKGPAYSLPIRLQSELNPHWAGQEYQRFSVHRQRRAVPPFY